MSDTLRALIVLMGLLSLALMLVAGAMIQMQGGAASPACAGVRAWVASDDHQAARAQAAQFVADYCR